MTQSADDWEERAGKEESDRLTPFRASPCPRWKSVEFVCPPFLPASSAAALFERLTAIVETTTAHLNAIRDAGGGGLGEVPGRRTSLFCQEDLIPDSQTGITVPGIGPGTGTSCGSFLMPGNGTCTPARQIPMWVLDPEPWGRFADMDRAKRWCIW